MVANSFITSRLIQDESPIFYARNQSCKSNLKLANDALDAANGLRDEDDDNVKRTLARMYKLQDMFGIALEKNHFSERIEKVFRGTND